MEYDRKQPRQRGQGQIDENAVRSKQPALTRRRDRPPKMGPVQARQTTVEPKLAREDLEGLAYLVGNRAFTDHAFAELGVVQSAAARVADARLDARFPGGLRPLKPFQKH